MHITVLFLISSLLLQPSLIILFIYSFSLSLPILHTLPQGPDAVRHILCRTNHLTALDPAAPGRLLARARAALRAQLKRMPRQVPQPEAKPLSALSADDATNAGSSSAGPGAPLSAATAAAVAAAEAAHTAAAKASGTVAIDSWEDDEVAVTASALAADTNVTGTLPTPAATTTTTPTSAGSASNDKSPANSASTPAKDATEPDSSSAVVIAGRRPPAAVAVAVKKMPRIFSVPRLPRIHLPLDLALAALSSSAAGAELGATDLAAAADTAQLTRPASLLTLTATEAKRDELICLALRQTEFNRQSYMAPGEEADAALIAADAAAAAAAANPGSDPALLRQMQLLRARDAAIAAFLGTAVPPFARAGPNDLQPPSLAGRFYYRRAPAPLQLLARVAVMSPPRPRCVALPLAALAAAPPAAAQAWLAAAAPALQPPAAAAAAAAWAAATAGWAQALLSAAGVAVPVIASSSPSGSAVAAGQSAAGQSSPAAALWPWRP